MKIIDLTLLKNTFTESDIFTIFQNSINGKRQGIQMLGRMTITREFDSSKVQTHFIWSEMTIMLCFRIVKNWDAADKDEK
jgi:hypothetical protein